MTEETPDCLEMAITKRDGIISVYLPKLPLPDGQLPIKFHNLTDEQIILTEFHDELIERSTD